MVHAKIQWIKSSKTSSAGQDIQRLGNIDQTGIKLSNLKFTHNFRYYLVFCIFYMRSFHHFFLLITLILVGCYPESLNYKLGWGTRFVEGTVLDDSGEVLKSKSFIVVLEYYSQFIQFENESPLYAPEARLIFPEENGRYRTGFDLEASAIELAFVASGYELLRFSFQRQIGIGELSFNARLSRSEMWKNQFLIQTSPFLENFILEQRYKMPDSQQLFLGNWLDTERKNINAFK